MQPKIDINSDLGEGGALDASIMPFISSCNIACGGHAGNIKSMQAGLDLAKKNNLKIGAHPSYKDFENFGRKSIKISSLKLYTDLAFQLENFHEIASKNKLTVNHWKPHGALYNDLFFDEAKAEVILELFYDFEFEGELYVAPGSKMKELALQEGFKISTEAFADRNYQSNLQLVPRSLPKAVITSPEVIAERLLKMILTKQVISLEGEIIDFDFQTVCLHSDTLNAIQIASCIHKTLQKNNIQIG